MIPPPPDLTNVEVKNLLGQFDHAIKFNSTDEFVIIHGPNGIGKTKLLELISNAFVPNVAALMGIPFDSANFVFSDDTSLQISRQQQLTLPPDEEDDEPKLTFTLRVPGKDVRAWTVGSGHFALEPGYAVTVDRRMRALGLPMRRIGSRRWRDITTGETFGVEELELRYGPMLHRRHFESHESQPEEMKRFFDSLHVHLIETQRLISSRYMRNRPHPGDEGEPQTATVLEFSEDLKRRFASALADNSRTSQKLDRQFPGRLLSGGSVPAAATEENIRNRYNEQGEIRGRLTEISLLDTSYELPLPARKLADWERLVLWTYLDDTDQKLRTFKPILERVDLMREIVNSRFLNKHLVIDRERGFRFKVRDSKEVGPDQLSSGEQHELVLVYDLLFNAAPNSLVLIDEPEISLHASWQQEFLQDIVRIANVTSLRFIIATHSPQIIHEWWPRTIALSPRSI